MIFMFLLFIIAALTGVLNRTCSLNTVYLMLDITDDIVHEHTQANTAILLTMQKDNN